MNELSATVKSLRKQFNMTQEDLSVKSGVGLRFVRDLEQGKSTLRLDKVNQLLDFFNYELIYGIVAILFGILIMTHSNTFASIVRIIIGIWIAYAGLMKINLSFKLKSANISAWAVVLILSIISLLAGILVMFSNTSSIVILTAVVMIIYAIADIIDEIIFISNVDKILE